MKKVIFLILDGAADVSYPELGGKTPIEAAEKPNMDGLARNGRAGILYPVDKGFAPESDSAAVSLLGYDVMETYTGRGPLEAIGAGLNMKDGDLAFRVNFATIDDNNVITDRRVCRDLSDEEASELTDAVNKKVRLTKCSSTFHMKNFRGFRGALVINKINGKLSGNLSNVDPGYTKDGVFSVMNSHPDFNLSPCMPLEDTKEARESAELTNEFMGKAREVLESHPVNLRRARLGKLKANVLLMRDAGDRVPRFQNLTERYGLRFGIVAEMPCEIGLGRLMGAQIIEVTQHHRNLKDYYTHLAHRVLEELKNLDAIYIHLKGPDNFGHDGQILKKRDSIEQIDKYFLGALLPYLKSDALVVVTSDHATPCYLGVHSSDPVPLLVCGPGVQADGIASFDEKSCQNGSLGTLMGPELMPLVLDLLQ